MLPRHHVVDAFNLRCRDTPLGQRWNGIQSEGEGVDVFKDNS